MRVEESSLGYVPAPKVAERARLRVVREEGLHKALREERVSEVMRRERAGRERGGDESKSRRV